MTDLDPLLARLAAMPTDARLDTLDAAVMRGVGERRDRTAARRSLMLAGIVAIGIGWAGSIVPGTPAEAAPMPLGMSQYAPSRLLGQ
ncbi:hypothetical protein [Sphingobium sp.]|uniref:hypothetical protein n=1 Tax=Sphingobium sp. TaxID=1912891 RepID=UPI003BB7DAF7